MITMLPDATATPPRVYMELAGAMMDCDRACPARAAVFVWRGERWLVMCGHCYRDHEHTLRSAGWDAVRLASAG